MYVSLIRQIIIPNECLKYKCDILSISSNEVDLLKYGEAGSMVNSYVGTKILYDHTFWNYIKDDIQKPMQQIL